MEISQEHEEQTAGGISGNPSFGSGTRKRVFNMKKQKSPIWKGFKNVKGRDL